MAITFTADFCDQQGVSLCDVRAAFKLTYGRNQAAKCEITLPDIEAEQATLLVAALTSGMPRMRVWRWAEGADEGTLVLNAVWMPMQEHAEDGEQTAGTVAATFRDPFALLEQRYTSFNHTASGLDASEIAWGLINTTNVLEGDTGILAWIFEDTVDRDRTYDDKQIAEAVTQLTEVQGGFDFEMAPVDEGTTIAHFNTFVRQGLDRSAGAGAVVFEYGPGTAGNVRSVDRETRSPVNKALVIGAEGLRAEKSDAASIAKYGTYKVVDQAIDVIEQATLDDKAQALLRPDPVRVVAFTPDPEAAPQPWDDYWIGDTVRFYANHGSLSLDVNVRVNGIEVSVDEDGNVASVNLTIDQAS